MKGTILWVAVGVLLIGGWLGYQVWYLNSDSYRSRFAARFDQLQKNDSYEQMIERVGRMPTHYCDVIVMSSAGTGSAPEKHYRDFIYRIGDTDFVTRFPKESLGVYGGLVEKRGPVPCIGTAAAWSH